MARLLRTLLATLAVLLIALGAGAALAAAESAAPPAAEPTGTSAEEGEAEPAPMSVEFPRRRASLVGARALVFVKCSGVVAETCEGTLVLTGVGGAHKVPFMIERGERQALAVPIGDETAVDHGDKARVIARTLQLSGGTIRTSSFLRFR